MSVASVEITASVRRFAEEMKKLPNITDKQAAKAAKSLQGQLEAAQVKAARSADRARQDAERAAMSLSDKLQVVAKTSSVLNGALGDATGPLGDFGDLLDMVDMRTAALAVGATAAAAAVVAVGMALAGAAQHAVDVVRNWEDYTEAAGGATERTAALSPAVREAQEALVGLDHQVAVVSLTLGGSLATGIDSAATALSGLTAISGDVLSVGHSLTEWLSESTLAAMAGRAAYTTFASVMPPFAAAVAQVTAAYEGLVWYGDRRNEQLREEQETLRFASFEAQRRAEVARDEAEAMAELLGVPGQTPVASDSAAAAEARQAAAEAEREAKHAAAEAKRRAADAEREAEHAAAEAKRRAEDARREAQRQHEEVERATQSLAQLSGRLTMQLGTEYDQIAARRDELLSQIYDLAFVSGDYATAAVAAERAQQQAVRETELVREQQVQAFVDGVEQQVQAQEQLAEAARRSAAAEADAAEQAKRRQQEFIATQVAAADGVVANTAAVTDAVLGLFNTQSEEGKRAYLAMFKVAKGVAIADIGVKTAQAVMASLTVPPPLGPALAITAAAAGVTQAIAAGAQQPQIAHSGRVLAADEALTVVQQGEVVVSAPQVARAGGAEEVSRRVDGGRAEQPAPILYADFTSGRVRVALRREGRTVDPLYGWAS